MRRRLAPALLLVLLTAACGSRPTAATDASGSALVLSPSPSPSPSEDLGPATPTPSSTEPPLGAIEGTVRDAGGSLLYGVCVSANDGTVIDGSVAEDLTQPDGRYRLRLPQGRYQVQFNDCWGAGEVYDDVQPTAEERDPTVVRVDAGQTTLGIDAVVDFRHAYAVVEVHRAGRPVPDVCVVPHVSSGEEIPHPPCFGCTRSTNDRGAVTLRFEEGGTYLFEVRRDCGDRTSLGWHRDATDPADADPVPLSPPVRRVVQISLTA